MLNPPLRYPSVDLGVRAFGARAAHPAEVGTIAGHDGADAKYQLTYDDSAAPKHYGWKQPARFGEIEKAYQDARNGAGPGPGRSGSTPCRRP